MVLGVQDGLTVFDADVLALKIAKFRQSLLEHFKPLRIGILGGHIAHDRHRLSGSVRNLNTSQQRQPERSSAPK